MQMHADGIEYLMLAFNSKEPSDCVHFLSFHLSEEMYSKTLGLLNLEVDMLLLR